MENQHATNPSGEQANATGTGEKTFTQEEVNRIVQERLSREKNKTPSEVERSLEEREKALAAREQEITFKAALRDRDIPEDVYEALNCTSEETFNKSLEILSPYFQRANEPILNAVAPTTGNTSTDDIRRVMGLK